MADIMEGVRILEVAEHTFVPAASAILADWGAEVIKVEHPERGDAMRGLASSGVMPSMGAVHVLLEHSNRGKKSIGIDVSTEKGLDLIYRLAATADVFLTNKVPAVRKKLHIELEDIRAHNPNIIYVAGTGGGERGPEADRGGYDFLSYWCRAGSAMGTTPTDVDYLAGQPGPGYGDSIGGMTIAGGILGALFHRERTGEALPLDVSLLGVGMWAMSPAIALSLQLDMPWRPGPEPRGRPWPPQPARRHLPDRGRPVPGLLVPAGIPLLAERLPGHRARRPDHRRAVLLARAAGGQCRRRPRHPERGLRVGAAERVEGPPRGLRGPVGGRPGQPGGHEGCPGRGERPPRGDGDRGRSALHAGHDAGAVRGRAVPAQAGTGVQRALRGDPRRHRLRRRRDDGAQGGRGRGVVAETGPRG